MFLFLRHNHQSFSSSQSSQLITPQQKQILINYKNQSQISIFIINSLIYRYSFDSQMMEPPQQSIRPQFHYHYKSNQQSVILDTQYNYEGTVMALCNSQGYILLYQAQNQEVTKEPYFIYCQQSRKQLKNNALLKIVWSLPQIGMLATCSIYQYISLFKVKNKTFVFSKEIDVDAIPVSLAFVPSEVQCLLTAGFSDGTIKIYNSELQVVQSIQAHSEVVNSIAWDTNIYKFEKNKWVEANFTNIQKNFGKTSYMLSCSSDHSIKLWKLTNSKLKLLGTCEKAHEKHVRMVDWKSNYFNEEEKTFVSCSEDHSVKIWSLKIFEDKCTFILKGSTVMKGPVYKAKYNFIGNLLAVSYCNEDEQKVQTKIFKQLNGTLCQQLRIQNY